MSAPVVIDARAAIRREIGGVERVARELARRLPALTPGRYAVACPRARLAHRAGHVWEQLALPVIHGDARLIYCPANIAPLASRRTVVVIHDAAAIRHPEWYRPAYAAWQRVALPLLARRARLVISPSAWARAELVDVLGADPDRVVVVANGVDERFRPDADAAPARAAYGLERPYVLAVGTRIARKNLEALERAARRLAEGGIDLVHAGSGRRYMRTERDSAARALGYVADEHLPGLYAGALALAMPSRYEGFGLPCLEAMAAGTPVVASTAGALPETCGDAAILLDPDDADGFADALCELATDEGRRARLAARGRERAERFTWERTARQTDDAIGRLLGATASP